MTHNPLVRYAHLALNGQSVPLLCLAHDGAQPGAAPDERRLGLVARVLVELTNATLYGAADHPAAPYKAATVRALAEGFGINRAEWLHRAVAELAEALGVEMPLALEGAATLANAGRVDLGDATVLARLLTHYPSNAAWQADLDDLYVWSQQ